MIFNFNDTLRGQISQETQKHVDLWMIYKTLAVISIQNCPYLINLSVYKLIKFIKYSFQNGNKNTPQEL